MLVAVYLLKEVSFQSYISGLGMSNASVSMSPTHLLGQVEEQEDGFPW